jgi:hypothetical protein
MKCSICGAEGEVAVMDVNISCRQGFRGSLFGEEWFIDMCPTCFFVQLIPWVESFGHARIEVDKYGDARLIDT